MNRRSSLESAAPTLRERIRESTVEAILAAAEDVFADAGLHAAHMGEIATRAGVSVGTLYNHFEDREALLAGLLAHRRTRFLAALDEAVGGEAAGRPFPERLRTLLVVALSHVQAHRKFFQITLQGEVGRYQQTFPSAFSVPCETMREIHTRFDKVMKRAAKEKAIRAEMIDLAPVLLMGMIRAMVIREMVLKEHSDLVGEADRLVRFFLEGLGT
jgi:AcrR family transcriptional regulator